MQRVRKINQIHKLFEHTSIAYEDIETCDLEKTLLIIDKLNKKAGNTFLNLEKDCLSATQFVGLIQAGDVAFEILPKIDYPIEPQSELTIVQAASSNFLVMLAYAYNINLDSHTLSTLKTQTGSWYDLLILFFAMELHKQIELGLSRNYILKEDSLNFIHGKWDITNQIKTHAYKMHQFDLIYDDFTDNILMNRIFKTIVEMLLLRTRNHTSRHLLLDIRQRLSNVDFILNIDEINNYEFNFDRLNKRFELAFNLAKLFFAGKSLQVRIGDTTSYAFVFDMNVIFQNFITYFIIKHQRKIFQDFDNKLVIKRQIDKNETYLTFDRVLAKGFLPLEPDVILDFPFSKIPRIIIDTKYKVLNPRLPSWGINRNDIFQMLAYSIGFATENLILLYPRPLLQPIHKRLDITRGDVDSKIFIQTVNLHQPLEHPINMIKDIKSIFQIILGGI